MKEAYVTRYGVHGEVMIRGVPGHWRHDPARRDPESDRFIIGFAGNAYASVKFEALVDGLCSAGWTIAGRKVALRIPGGTVGLAIRSAAITDAYGNVIPISVFQMLRRQTLTIFGDDEQTRDFVNVHDVVQASLKAAGGRSTRGTRESLTEYLAWAREEVARG